MNYDRSIETEGAIPAMHDRMVDSELSDFGTDDDARAPNKICGPIATCVDWD